MGTAAPPPLPLPLALLAVLPMLPANFLTVPMGAAMEPTAAPVTRPPALPALTVLPRDTEGLAALACAPEYEALAALGGAFLVEAERATGVRVGVAAGAGAVAVREAVALLGVW